MRGSLSLLLKHPLMKANSIIGVSEAIIRAAAARHSQCMIMSMIMTMTKVILVFDSAHARV